SASPNALPKPRPPPVTTATLPDRSSSPMRGSLVRRDAAGRQGNPFGQGEGRQYGERAHPRDRPYRKVIGKGRRVDFVAAAHDIHGAQAWHQLRPDAPEPAANNRNQPRDLAAPSGRRRLRDDRRRHREKHRRTEADDDQLRDNLWKAVDIDDEPDEPACHGQYTACHHRETSAAARRKPAPERTGENRTDV